MCREWLIFLLFITCNLLVAGQELPGNTQQQLENFSERNETEPEDDQYIQDLESFRKNQVDLNTAGVDELRELGMLSEIQLDNFFRYRDLFGSLGSIYELQAVPGWDILIIRKLLPYICIGKKSSLEKMRDWLKKGEHNLVIRTAQVLEKAEGYAAPDSSVTYPGGPHRLMLRYRYKFKNLLQYGITAEKDPGERGLDFFSFHLFIRKPGVVREIAVGDFTVNLGQGLVIWQGMSYGKTSEVSSIKQQSAPFKPYNSAGEFFFSRGAGIALEIKKSSLRIFISRKNLSATTYFDSIRNENYFSSFNSSGYHRTVNEINGRGTVGQMVYGGDFRLRSKTWEVGIGGAGINYSIPLMKRDELYNLYSLAGRSWYNLGLHYGLTYKNLHFFGEASFDKRKTFAFINGLMLSVGARADLAVLQRTIPSRYQAPLGNGFTENSTVTNETGIYYGIYLRPDPAIKFAAFADLFTFPWLKFRVDAPSRGKEIQVQFTYVPNRRFEIYSRYRIQAKQLNSTDFSAVTNGVGYEKRSSVRTHFEFKPGKTVTVRERLECLWYSFEGKHEQGFLVFSDIFYHPMMSRWGVNFRYSQFETSGYASRLYAYENDVLYGSSVPAFYGKGIRFYFNFNFKLSEIVTVWIKYSRTSYRDQATLGSGAEEMAGNRKSEIKFQIRCIF